MMNVMRGAGCCLEAVDGHGHTVDESYLLEAAKVERVVQVEDLECVRPVLAVDGDEVRDLQLGGLQELDASRAAHHDLVGEHLACNKNKSG